MRAKFTLEWEVFHEDLSVCISAHVPNSTSTDWIGLGFSGVKTPGMGMNHSDIVVAWQTPKVCASCGMRCVLWW